jgi:3-oxosteroid 1-dehydrogenase
LKSWETKETKERAMSEADAEQIPDTDGWDRVADVVVVGSGAAGWAAAISAASQGCSVIVLERQAHPGGTSAKSGFVFWIPNNDLMRAAGIEDPKPDALKYMARLSYPHLYNPAHATLGLPQDRHDLIETYYDKASGVIAELVAAGALDIALDTGTPDYHADLPEDKAPYGRHLMPRVPPSDPTATAGIGVIEGLRACAEGLGVILSLDHRVVDVITADDGTILGVEAHRKRGTVIVRALRAVIFASGGFAHNETLVREYLRGPIFGGCASEGSTGDFVRIGTKLGAQFGNMSNAWWSQVVVETALNHRSTNKDVWLPAGDSMIQVNRFAERVANEKTPYNERAQVHFVWDPTRREYRNRLLFWIYDDAVAQNPHFWYVRQPIPMPDDDLAPYVITGQTWEDLIAAISTRLAEIADRTGGIALADEFTENLKHTIARFNEMAAQGVDRDFGRGESPLSRALPWNGPPRSPDMPNPAMHPFSPAGPYHAIILGAGALDTKGGPMINARGQILDTDGMPIERLYGAGNCIAAPAGQAYWSGGGTIGPALAFGYLAGADAAKQPRR